MLRSFAVYSLLVILLLQSSSKVIVVTMWWLKRDYIAKNFCINRLKPSLHCDGKCFLMKKLRDAEQKQKDSMPDLKNFQEMFWIKPEMIFLNQTWPCFPEINEISGDNASGSSQYFLRKILNPPEVL